MHILLLGGTHGVDLGAIYAAMIGVANVASVHKPRLWSEARDDIYGNRVVRGRRELALLTQANGAPGGVLALLLTATGKSLIGGVQVFRRATAELRMVAV